MFLKAYHSGLNYLDFFLSLFRMAFTVLPKSNISLRRPTDANKSAEIKEFASFNLSETMVLGRKSLNFSPSVPTSVQ